MGNFNRDDNRSGGYRGGFSRGGGRGGFGGGGRSSFGGGRGGDRGDRQMFDATCSSCGKPCQVPFRPTNGKPVYCSDCFEKMGGRSDSGSSDRPRFEDRKPSFDPNKAQLDAINVKLDKLLNILQPKAVEPIVLAKSSSEPKAEKTKGSEPVEKIADKVDLPKIKKAVKKAASSKKKDLVVNS